MKKLKILPSVLMLVLCVGVLAVGVFAITPTTNTISGSITINATNAPVSITVYKDTYGGEVLGTIDPVRTEGTLNLNQKVIEFLIEDANNAGEVEPIVLVVEFSTTSSAHLVVDTETIESFNGQTESGAKLENLVSVTKLHEYELTDEQTGLACFTSGSNYVVTCVFRLGELVEENVTVAFDLSFNICKASNYEGDGINGVDYLYFGEYPQSEVNVENLELSDTGEVFNAYDSALGNKIYSDEAGNRYVEIVGAYESGEYYLSGGEPNVAKTEKTKYFLIEPLKWRFYERYENFAVIMCDQVVAFCPYDQDSEFNNQNIDYSISDLRNFLTDNFYNSAFTNLNKQLIVSNTSVINCEDMVFTFDSNEVAMYALDAVGSTYSATRMFKCSNYAEATGVWTYGLDVVEEYYVVEQYYDSVYDYYVNGAELSADEANAIIEYLENNEASFFNLRDGCVEYEGCIFAGDSGSMDLYNGCLPALNIRFDY